MNPQDKPSGDLNAPSSGGQDDPERTRIFDPSRSLDIHEPSVGGSGFEIPGYRLVREVGRGGMGKVFEAVQVSTRRTVALKIMLEGPFTSEKTKRRFEREVHIVASLRHPNIAQIYESGLHQGRYWFAMEYIDGKPLDDQQMVGRLEMNDRLVLMATVCEAVGHAHDQMVVHRDLKPSNILVSRDGQPHILDFGLAKVEDPERRHELTLSMAGELMGTPAYMSPEQTERDPSKIDARTDVYSLGVILYQLLTGQFPYDVRGRLDEVIRHIATTDPTRPSHVSRAIDSEAEAIILKAIAKNPEERYPTAKAMAQDLRRLLAGEPIEAKLTSRSYILTKTIKRHRWPLIGAGVLLLAIAGSVLVTRAYLMRPGKTEEPNTAVALVAQAGPNEGPAGLGRAKSTPPQVESVIPVIVRRDSDPPALDSKPSRHRSTRESESALTQPTAVQIPPGSSPRQATAETRPAVSRGLTTTRPPYRGAQFWLAQLAARTKEGDYLRARFALERLRKRFSDAPAVVQAAKEIQECSEVIDSKLGQNTIQDKGEYSLHVRPMNTADWQAAMEIAREIVAADGRLGIAVVRVLLENTEIESGAVVEGRNVKFHGGSVAGDRIQVQSGDILFVGSENQGGEAPAIKIIAIHHYSPLIVLNLQPGQVVRVGDVVVQDKD